MLLDRFAANLPRRECAEWRQGDDLGFQMAGAEVVERAQQWWLQGYMDGSKKSCPQKPIIVGEVLDAEWMEDVGREPTNSEQQLQLFLSVVVAAAAAAFARLGIDAPQKDCPRVQGPTQARSSFLSFYPFILLSFFPFKVLVASRNQNVSRSRLLTGAHRKESSAGRQLRTISSKAPHRIRT